MTQINQSKSPSKCCTKGCNNATTNYFDGKKQKIHLCDECLLALTEKAMGLRVPKSPTNTIKKIIDKKQEETYV